METQLNLIPASEHPTALESQWLNAISPADFINNNKNDDEVSLCDPRDPNKAGSP